MTQPLTRYRALGAVAALLGCLGACEATPPPAPPQPPEAPKVDPRLERAKATATALQTQLKAALTEAIAAKGVAGAVDVCHSVAPAIATTLSVDGVTVARTGVRLRNTANTTPAWLAGDLARWAALPAAERQPTSTVLDDGRLAFAAPLSMQPLCLACHGDAVAADVKAAIDARYPQDAATGFGTDALRGAVWVVVASATP